MVDNFLNLFLAVFLVNLCTILCLLMRFRGFHKLSSKEQNSYRNNGTNERSNSGNYKDFHQNVSYNLKCLVRPIKFINKDIKPTLPGYKYNNRYESGYKEDIKYYFEDGIPRLFRIVNHIPATYLKCKRSIKQGICYVNHNRRIPIRLS